MIGRAERGIKYSSSFCLEFWYIVLTVTDTHRTMGSYYLIWEDHFNLITGGGASGATLHYGHAGAPNDQTIKVMDKRYL